MAPKRPGKEIASSSAGGNKKQTAPKNHDITFRTPEQRSRYKSLLSNLCILVGTRITMR